MTQLEKQKLIGKNALLNSKEIDAAIVVIQDARASFGRKDVLVMNPLNKQEAWKDLEKVKIV